MNRFTYCSHYILPGYHEAVYVTVGKILQILKICHIHHFWIFFHHISPNQWPFQDPKLEVPTIYKAYVRPM